MEFWSPTKGKLTLEETIEDIRAYIGQLPATAYKLVIGSDSQSGSNTCFVTAVIVQRIGNGARFYYQKKTQRVIKSLRQKIFYETSLSLELGCQIYQRLRQAGLNDIRVEIHLDVGLQGPTKELVREVTGMVNGNGFPAKIKPDAFGASVVADKYTK
ncbi:MAG: ribonuclease H-like YkuK family protein [Clostridia bacterium]|nr:ribonuclease H-like YkuK family protein [Clostridia bacterium]